MRKKILALLLALAAIGAHAQEGSWKGELDLKSIKLPLVFHFNGKDCTLDSPTQGVTGIKAEKTIQNGKVTIKIPTIGATFEGVTLAKTISGTFTQNGMSLPLTLTPGTIEIKRPQTPVAPFPYQEEKVSFTNGKFTLNGTLTLPKNYTKATPVVVMITGSGQQNRDEELFNHKPFAVIADALARQGIASLRYDDRGYGDKTVIFTDFTTDDFKQDAETAINLLRKRFDRVGVLGHSEGGTIALMLGAEQKADFIVSLAGLAVSGKETLLWQNRQMLSTMGLPANMVDGYCSIVDQIFTAIAEGKQIDQLSGDNVPIAYKPLIDKAKETLSTPYMQHFIKVDVRPQLPLVKCPVLALNGTKDTQVGCELNIKALQEGLTNCTHTVKTIEDVNHLFQHCNTGAIIEYQQIEETISPEVLNTIATWIRAIK